MLNSSRVWILEPSFSLWQWSKFSWSIYVCVRYGNQVAADELNSLYKDSRAKGFGPEVQTFLLAFVEYEFNNFLYSQAHFVELLSLASYSDLNQKFKSFGCLPMFL